MYKLTSVYCDTRLKLATVTINGQIGTGNGEQKMAIISAVNDILQHNGYGEVIEEVEVSDLLPFGMWTLTNRKIRCKLIVKIRNDIKVEGTADGDNIEESIAHSYLDALFQVRKMLNRAGVI